MGGGWWLESARKGGPDTLPVININPEVGLVGSDGAVRMVSEVVEKERRDKEAKASKDYTGLIPEVYQATATALLGELEEDSEALEALMVGTRKKMEERLENARKLVKEGSPQ